MVLATDSLHLTGFETVFEKDLRQEKTDFLLLRAWWSCETVHWAFPFSPSKYIKFAQTAHKIYFNWTMAKQEHRVPTQWSSWIPSKSGYSKIYSNFGLNFLGHPHSRSFYSIKQSITKRENGAKQEMTTSMCPEMGKASVHKSSSPKCCLWKYPKRWQNSQRGLRMQLMLVNKWATAAGGKKSPSSAKHTV